MPRHLASDPSERVAAARLLAEELLAAGDRIGARRALLPALAAVEPDDLDAAHLHDALGMTAIAIGDLDEAGFRLSRARSIARRYEDVALLAAVEQHRGRLALERGELATAEARTLRASRLRDGPLVRAQLGAIVSARGRHAEAIALLEDALAELPHPVGRAWLGSALRRAGDCARAEVELRAALADAGDHPDLAPALLDLAALADERGDPESGLALAVRAAGALEGRVAAGHPCLALATARARPTARAGRSG